MKTVKVLVGILVLSCPQAAFAKDNTWSGFGKVLATYVDIRGTPGRILIKHEAQREDDCQNGGNHYHLDLGHQDAQFIYSMVLSAEAQQTNIRMYYSGCSTAGYPIVKIASTF